MLPLRLPGSVDQRSVPMKVYLAGWQEHIEYYTEIEGVFSSREKAEAWVAAQPKDIYKDWFVEGWEVDGAYL